MGHVTRLMRHDAGDLIGRIQVINVPVLMNMFCPSATKALSAGSLTMYRCTSWGTRPAVTRIGSSLDRNTRSTSVSRIKASS